MDAPKPTDSSRDHGRHEPRPPSDPGAARDPAELIVKDVAFEAMKWLLRFDGDTSRLSEVGLAALEWTGARPDERDVYLIRGEPKRNFVRNSEGRAWVTRPILKARGWTAAAIRDFLPGAEGFKPNPRFAETGDPMPVWLPETVAEAEATAEWQQWLRKSLRRRGKTLHELASAVDGDFRRRFEAVQEAVEAYHRAQIVRGSTGGGGKRAAE
ncbi:hypothetical protein [Glycomyces tenuis]|uniref:hypothetical protein n=1 Tax=Glycomyces tenuis TaxID=58116 RepID=UPI0004282D73|nr:hypothetical protein [Glycomyces tenuis]